MVPEPAPGPGSGWWARWHEPLIGPLTVGVAATPFVWAEVARLTDEENPPGARTVSTSIFRTGNQGGTYVFPDARDLTPAERRAAYAAEQSASREKADAWFRSRGGVDPHESNVQVVVQGLRPEPVRITDMEVDAHCTDPLTGTTARTPTA
ncbi:hypothetical protein AT728_27370 [Streptomyces silvensis]|uniref:Uncharacterized protein n=1 Tax=Streptomyces silvensis TaxID=1765722 RepID=A0A0W7WX45_9ACTN|nr:hypothetical protein AT728_27370 [Streptomyces silvensis]